MHLQNPRRIKIRRPFSLDGLGAWGENIPADAVYWNTYPTVVPPSGFKEKILPATMGGGAAFDQLVPRMLTVQNFDRGGGSHSVSNPHYAAPGSTNTDWIMSQARAGKMTVTLPPLTADTQAAWQTQRNTIPLFTTNVVGVTSGTYPNQQGVTGAASGKVYVSNPQAWLNRIASNNYGAMKGYINKKDWLDFIDSAFEFLVEAIVIAGVAYGAYLVAAQAAGTAASSSSTATTSTAATEAGSSVAPAYGGVGTSGAGAGSDAIITGGTSSSFGTSAAGALKTGVGYVKTAKEIMGVASAIKAATSSKPAATQPAPSLDSSYYSGGSGSGGGAGGSGSAPSLLTQLTTGSTPLYIGGGVLVLIAALMLGAGRSSPTRRTRRHR